MKAKKQGMRRNRTGRERPGRAMSCLPFLNDESARIFNIYVHCEGGVIREVSATEHVRRAASLEKKISFLERNIYSGMEGAVAYALPETYISWKSKMKKRKRVPRTLTLEAYRAIMRRGDAVSFLDAALQGLDILEDSIFIATLIVDGEVDSEQVLYI